MGLPDKHDTRGPTGSRLFTHFAVVDDDGTVLAVREIDAAALTSSAHPDVTDPRCLYVDITEDVRQKQPTPSKISLPRVNGAKARRDDAQAIPPKAPNGG